MRVSYARDRVGAVQVQACAKHILDLLRGRPLILVEKSHQFRFIKPINFGCTAETDKAGLKIPTL
jgi:hypothetical protein